MRYENGFTIEETTVTNEPGIHARPSAFIVKRCNPYLVENKNIEIYLAKTKSPEEKASCFSIMDLMTLEASRGTKLLVYIKGTDERAQRICREVSDLVSGDFEGASNKPASKI